jgi:general stress protein YciG
MSGNREGGRKTAASLKAKDPDYYVKIGQLGGKKGTTGGFAANRELASEAGRKGGLARWRGRAETKPVTPPSPEVRT